MYSSELQTLAKAFIWDQFRIYNIPKGYHNVNFSGIYKIFSVKIVSLDPIFSYPSKIIRNSFEVAATEYIFADTEIVELTPTTLIFRINMKTFDVYSYKVITEFPWVQRFMIQNSHRLYYQLKSHNLENFDTRNVDKYFNWFCQKSEELYTALFLTHWNQNQNYIEDYNNDTLISLFLPYIKITYDHLIAALNDNIYVIPLLLPKIELHDKDRNFDLLKASIKTNNVDITNMILTKCKEFIDWGLLLETLRTDNIEMVNIFLKDVRVKKTDLLKDAIEYQNFEIIKHLLVSRSCAVDLSHLEMAKCKRNNIYSLLLTAVDDRY